MESFLDYPDRTDQISQLSNEQKFSFLSFCLKEASLNLEVSNNLSLQIEKEREFILDLMTKVENSKHIEINEILTKLINIHLNSISDYVLLLIIRKNKNIITNDFEILKQKQLDFLKEKLI